MGVVLCCVLCVACPALVLFDFDDGREKTSRHRDPPRTLSRPSTNAICSTPQRLSVLSTYLLSRLCSTPCLPLSPSGVCPVNSPFLVANRPNSSSIFQLLHRERYPTTVAVVNECCGLLLCAVVNECCGLLSGCSTPSNIGITKGNSSQKK